MATISHNKGYWQINVMLYDEATGKKVRRRISTGLKATPENRKIAEEKYLKAVDKQDKNNQLVIPQKSKTIITLGNEFIAKKKINGKVRAYVLRGYQNSLKQHIYPLNGDKAIELFTEEDINTIHRSLLTKLSAKRVKNISIPLKGLFDLAYSKRIIDKNPYDKADPISDKKTHLESIYKVKELNKLLESNNLNAFEKAFDTYSKNKIDPFSEKELKILINKAKGMFKNYIALSYLLGGIRPSELIALTWKKVNFKTNTVYVLGSVTGKETEDEKNLNKSISSVRKVFISDLAKKYLNDQYKKTAHKNSTVFLNQYGKSFASIQSLRDNRFKKLLEVTGVRPRRLYDIRHSFASINLSKGRLPITLISQMMGHKDTRVTYEKYSAYISDSEDETLELINKAYESFN